MTKPINICITGGTGYMGQRLIPLLLARGHRVRVVARESSVRAMGEAIIKQTGLTATILRPWYVLGPGHWWPMVLMPLYKIAELFPSTRASAQRLGLITIGQMVNALVDGVEHPPPGGQIRVVEVPAIRLAGNRSDGTASMV
jgi:uncharacterized protein YbjT (DUF2867 family)